MTSDVVIAIHFNPCPTRLLQNICMRHKRKGDALCTLRRFMRHKIAFLQITIKSYSNSCLLNTYKEHNFLIGMAMCLLWLIRSSNLRFCHLWGKFLNYNPQFSSILTLFRPFDCKKHWGFYIELLFVELFLRWKIVRCILCWLPI